MPSIDVHPATATRRVLACWQLAQLGPDGRPHGIDWYREAHAEMGRLAGAFGLSIAQAAGITAALSPQTDWPINLRLAWQVCTDGTARQTRANLAKALAIREGADPAAVFAPKRRPWDGAKVRSFYANLADPEDDGQVTIDRHMAAIIIGHPLTRSEADVLARKGSYDFCVAAVRRAAARQGVLGIEMQATAWTTWTQHMRRRRPVGGQRRRLAEVLDAEHNPWSNWLREKGAA